MPNPWDVVTLHGRLGAGRPTLAPEAHHDDVTFLPPAPPYAGVGEPRAGLEGYHAVREDKRGQEL